jgi:tryptophan-rich sensory protein
MKKAIPYIVSPLFYLAVAYAGRLFTAKGVTTWYPAIEKPSFTPPGSLIGLVWTTIFILTAISLILYIRSGKGKALFRGTIFLYVFNGILNAAWSYFFFTKHFIGIAVLDALLIALTVGLMMVLSWRYSKASSILLLPYLLWVSFATYLTFTIYTLN